MITISQTIILGVVSGVITSAILWCIVIFFKKVITPWYEQRIYKGVNISGAWSSVKQNDHWKLEIFLNLKQKAYLVTGSLQAKTTFPGIEYTNYYKVSGKIFDNHLLITYSAQPVNRTGVGSFLLRVAHGGTELRGSAAYIADGNLDEITSLNELKFNRS